MSSSINNAWYMLDWLDYLIIGINLSLIVFAGPLLDRLIPKQNERQRLFKLTLIRGINLLIITIVSYRHIAASGEVDNSFLIKLITILVVVYLGYFSSLIAAYLIRQRYGRLREVAGEQQATETYQSRLLTILTTVAITIISLITIIQIIGYTSLLEASGVIGIIGVFLALTQSAWAPDIISGLVILNSKMVEEGDVIEVKGSDGFIGVVFKTKIFHTELLNLADNHRIMISNQQLRAHTLHNLSKFASAKGMRQNLRFKIGYDVPPSAVKKMLQTAFDAAAETPDITYQSQYPIDIRVIETGDHAVEWGVFYYIKNSADLLKTRHHLIETVLITAIDQHIALSTPITHQLDSSSIDNNQ